jgi:RNA polymerase sigma-70 factor, ECF subfamily
LKAYKHFHSFNQNSSPKTWLFSIAHNLTVDFLRKRKPLRIFKEIFNQERESCSLPEQYVQMKESSMELYEAIGNLKESYRKVIILRKIKGFSISEVSEILNWSESKVKSTLHRAIQLLEKKLSKEEYLNEQIKRG